MATRHPIRKRHVAVGGLLIMTIATFAGALHRPAHAAAPAKTPDVDKLLQKGNLPAVETRLKQHLSDNPKDDNARFGLGAVQFLRGIERLVQSLHKYGLRSRARFVPFLRLPAPRNIEPEEIRYEHMRRIYEELQADLTKAEKTLAGIKRKDVTLPLHFGLIRMDLNGDGQAEDRETLWKIYANLTRARNVNAAQAKQFVIIFDRGDVHWLRGYCHLLLGLTDFILAHDWKDNFDRTAQLFFKSVDSAYAYLRRSEEDSRRMFDSVDIADAIAFIHLIRFDVKEPKRMKSALLHLETMIAQSRLCWKHVEAETDDDNEWIPNAQQTGVIPGVRMTAARIKTWKEFLDEADAILKGKKLVPHWRIKDGRGVNLRRVFTEPRRFDLVLWVQGSAAKPYLERGPLTQPDFWRRLRGTFRGNFIGFAVWLN